MQGILQDSYYNISSLEKYSVQTRSQVKSSGISSWCRKRLGLKHTARKKQMIRPIIPKVREDLQIKSRLGQGRAGLRHKIKTQISKLLHKQ